MAEDRGPWLSIATVLFFSWALLSCCVRIWVTLRKRSWEHSDTGVVSATIIAILHVAVNFWAISNSYGRPIAEIGGSHMGNVEKALFTSQLSYISSIGMTRVSTALFIGQLTRHPPQVRMSKVLASIAGGWTAASILIVALRGDLAQPWTVLDGTQPLFYRWIAVETGGLTVEIALWSLSISLIWGLQMKLQKQTLILAAFGCRLLLIPIIAVRLFYLSPDENYDPTLTSIIPHILTEAAMSYALISTSITSLKPFLKPFHAGAVVNTVGGKGSGAYSGSHPRGQGIYMLSSVSNDPKGVEQRTATTVNSDDDNQTLPPGSTFGVSNTGEVTTVVSSRPNPQGEEDESGDRTGLGQILVHRTTEWNVCHDSCERLT